MELDRRTDWQSVLHPTAKGVACGGRIANPSYNYRDVGIFPSTRSLNHSNVSSSNFSFRNSTSRSHGLSGRSRIATVSARL